MSIIAEYLTSLDINSVPVLLSLLFDLVALLATFFIIFYFLKKRNNLKLALLFSIAGVAYLGINIANQFFERNYLVFTTVLLQIIMVFLIAVTVIAYQAEIKTALFKLGKRKAARIESFSSYDELKKVSQEIVKVVQKSSKNDVGALIVMTNSDLPENILESGVSIDAKISASLLESIFNTSAPLHDGATVIIGNRIVAASCFLQISESAMHDKELGTRHRAAIGISEMRPDVLVIVISEETGIISIVKKGKIKRYISSEYLQSEIYDFYGLSEKGRTDINAK